MKKPRIDGGKLLSVALIAVLLIFAAVLFVNLALF
jgi:hypothetical protein